jgi:phosphoribosyl 1,2-cyclic phosphodiesterase
VAVRTAVLNHPGGATAYRIDFDGRSICYVTGTEHPEDGRDARIVELIAGSEIVIYDATFTDEEYPQYRGWGHSTWQEGVRLCEAAGAGRLVTFHHLPEHDDADLDRIAAVLADVRPGSLVGREGLVMEP